MRSSACAPLAALCLLHAAAAIKVKMLVRSEEDSAADDSAPAAAPAPAAPPPPRTERADAWDAEEPTLMPYIKTRKHKAKTPEYEERPTAPAAPAHQQPNAMFFPLVYKQSHISSVFKMEGNWYTWAVEKHADGTKSINYYYCNDEPKHCDEIGWEHIDAPPKCAFQIHSLTYDDRACTSSFGADQRSGAGGCNGAEQTKVNDIVKSCGSRIRSLWRFARAARRPAAAAKPADVNSLICEDEDECYVTVEYRIHHDRITFSLHEPTRGQTFKSALKRDQLTEEEPASPATKAPAHRRKPAPPQPPPPPPARKKTHRARTKPAEGKGVAKERDDSAYTYRRSAKNKNRISDDVSDDISE